MYTRNQQRSGGNPRPTRRYNKPGTFVPGGQHHNNEQQQYDNQQHNQRNNDYDDQPPLPLQENENLIEVQHQMQQGPPPLMQQQVKTEAPPLPPLPPQSPKDFPQVFSQDQEQDLEIKQSQGMDDSIADSAESTPKKPWMKPKGIFKLSNRERRRRQNLRFSKVLIPKNALMILNEMNSGHIKFDVEPTTVNNYGAPKLGGQYVASLMADGKEYKGYAPSKVLARNDAAEQAIRDLILKKMEKQNLKMETGSNADSKGSTDVDGNGDVEMTGDDDDDDTIPILKLASYALHKLFVEWQAEGYKIPLMKDCTTRIPPAAVGAGDSETGSEAGAVAEPPRPEKVKEPRVLPADATDMHPCMLLGHMRPRTNYQEISVEGDKPQNIMFTMGINIDGATYIGRACNKKEARKNAARSACQEVFGVQFNDGQSQAQKIA